MVMIVKKKYIDYFMQVAELTANLSKANRLKVGSIIVKDNRIISCGYNGLPSGFDDSLIEFPLHISVEEYHNLDYNSRHRFSYDPVNTIYIGSKTNDSVIHAEQNAISRLASSHESGVGSIMFCTHSPCHNCSKIIYSAGITELYYKEEYRSSEGLIFLKQCGIEVKKYEKLVEKNF